MTPSGLRRWVTQRLAADLVRDLVNSLGPGASVMPLKGVLLARTVYDRPDDRALVDVDAVVLRPSLPVALHRLRRAGWVLTSWSGDRHLQLDSPRVRGLSLDLHTRPLPPGFGRVDTPWLADGARTDTALFGVPVLVPDPRRTLVAILGSVVRDFFVLSPAHVPEDLARLVARSPCPPSDFALAIRHARLVHMAWAALDYVLDHSPSPALRAVQSLLGVSERQGRALAQWSNAVQRSARGGAAHPLAWTLIPLGSDRVTDAFRGLGAYAVGLPVGMLNRYLQKPPIR